MPNIPNTSTAGLVLTSRGTGLNDSVWSSVGTAQYYDSQTYSISGLLAAWSSGASNYLPSFFYAVQPGQTVTLAGVCGMVHGGTSITYSVYRGTGGVALPGSSIGGLTGLTASTSVPTSLTAPTSTVTLGTLDYFNIQITGISGTPDGGTVTFVFQVTT